MRIIARCACCGHVVDVATRVVDDLASARDRAWWHELDAAQCVAHALTVPNRA